MKKLFAALALTLLCVPAFAEKNCEELRDQIAAKIESKGVKSYSLEIVAKDAAAEGKVVGSCERGSKKIVYKKG